jgi:hypothetical protein
MITKAIRGSGVPRAGCCGCSVWLPDGFEKYVQSIPAYKHENYLEFCAKYDTILKQDTKKYE